MKIGIFGDSFGEEHKKNHTKSWWEYVSYNYQIENFSLGGSDIYYSVSKIKKLHEKFDKMIWFVTNPSRIKLNNRAVFESEIQQFIVSSLHADSYLDIYRSRNDKNLHLLEEMLLSAKSYFKHIVDTEKDDYIASLMIDDIKRLRGDDILTIPCFPELNLGTMSLVEVYLMENTVFMVDGKEEHSVLTDDKRNNHLTKENAEILGNKILNWIRTGTFSMTKSDFLTPDISMRNIYFYE